VADWALDGAAGEREACSIGRPHRRKSCCPVLGSRVVLGLTIELHRVVPDAASFREPTSALSPVPRTTGNHSLSLQTTNWNADSETADRSFGPCLGSPALKSSRADPRLDDVELGARSSA
jgi:hypothetical protein